jgi:hypothetical protein
MDRYDLTFDVDAVRARFPDLPRTSPAQVLQALHAADRSPNHPATERPS